MSARNKLIILFLLMAVAASLALIDGGVFAGARAHRNVPVSIPENGYVRINISDACTVFLEFNGSELRAAATVERLKTAEPVQLSMAQGRNLQQSPEFTLPIGGAQLPEGITGIKGSFNPNRFSPIGILGICRADEHKTIWQADVVCWTNAMGRTPDSAPAMQFRDVRKNTTLGHLPKVEKVALTLRCMPRNYKLEVYVGLLADCGLQVMGVRREDKPAAIYASVLDASGAQISAKMGVLADFGFS